MGKASKRKKSGNKRRQPRHICTVHGIGPVIDGYTVPAGCRGFIGAPGNFRKLETVAGGSLSGIAYRLLRPELPPDDERQLWMYVFRTENRPGMSGGKAEGIPGNVFSVPEGTRVERDDPGNVCCLDPDGGHRIYRNTWDDRIVFGTQQVPAGTQCQDCSASSDGERTVHDKTCPSFTDLDRISREDREWFKDNPGEDQRFRPMIPAELDAWRQSPENRRELDKLGSIPGEWYVGVRKVPDGRTRQPFRIMSPEAGNDG